MKCLPLSLIMILFLFSCTTYRYTYAPEPANNPIFTQKGDASLEVAAFSNKPLPLPDHYSNGLNLQAAYAIGNHLATAYSYNKKWEKDINKWDDGTSYFSYFDSSNTLYNRQSYELGLGGYWFVDNKKQFQFSVYGGYGWGNFSITDRIMDNSSPFTRTFSAKTSKLFVQPSFSFLTKYVSGSFILKASCLNYSSIKTTYLYDELTAYELQRIGSRKPIILEPSFNFLFYLLSSKALYLKTGCGISLYGSRESHRWNFIHAGIGVDPIKIFRAKKQ